MASICSGGRRRLRRTSWKLCQTLERLERSLQRRGEHGDDQARQHHDARVAERKEQSDRVRAAAFLHQLADHIVDRRNVVGVDGVPQPENVGEQGGPQQGRLAGESGERPEPGDDIGGDEQRVDTGELLHLGSRGVVEQLRQRHSHRCSSCPRWNRMPLFRYLPVAAAGWRAVRWIVVRV
jgi:hypothetical protein